MDRYQELRARAVRVSGEVIGLTRGRAVEHIQVNGLQARIVRVDGKGQMRTNDVKMDRLGLHIRDDHVERVELG